MTGLQLEKKRSRIEPETSPVSAIAQAGRAQASPRWPTPTSHVVRYGIADKALLYMSATDPGEMDDTELELLE